MHATHTLMSNQDEPGRYEIRLKGQLEARWADWFAGLTITWEDSGDTLLSGPVADQAALYGLLRKVRDLGLPLVSVLRVEPEPPHRPAVTIDPDHHCSTQETTL